MPPLFFKFTYFERERESVSREGAERERERGSKRMIVQHLRWGSN